MILASIARKDKYLGQILQKVFGLVFNGCMLLRQMIPADYVLKAEYFDSELYMLHWKYR